MARELKCVYCVLAVWMLSSMLAGQVRASVDSALVLTSRLVSTEWLAQNLNNKNLRIIDVRSTVRDYWENHVPGAVYLSPEALRMADRGVPGKLMPAEVLVVMLGKMGVGRNTAVAVYAEQSDFKPAYLVWALDYLGHPSSAILDGGFTKWKEEGRPVTQDYPAVTPVEYRLPASGSGPANVRATLEQVLEAVRAAGSGQNKGALLLDARPQELYTGEKGSWKRKGHIKGALNHFWGTDINEDGTWKSREELSAVFAELGALPERPVIVYCGQGQMSSHLYFTLRHVLGYGDVKNYDGSFNEWSNREELPVETGGAR